MSILLSIAFRAIIRIQRWFRKKMANLEMKRSQTWKIFETLEYSNEQDQNKVNDEHPKHAHHQVRSVILGDSTPV